MTAVRWRRLVNAGLALSLWAGQSCSDPDVSEPERRRVTSLMPQSVYLQTLQNQQEASSGASPVGSNSPMATDFPPNQTTGDPRDSASEMQANMSPEAIETGESKPKIPLLNEQMQSNEKVESPTNQATPTSVATQLVPMMESMSTVKPEEAMPVTTPTASPTSSIPSQTATPSPPVVEETVLSWEPKELFNLMVKHCSCHDTWIYYKDRTLQRKDSINYRVNTLRNMPPGQNSFSSSADGRRMIELLNSL